MVFPARLMVFKCPLPLLFPAWKCPLKVPPSAPLVPPSATPRAPSRFQTILCDTILRCRLRVVSVDFFESATHLFLFHGVQMRAWM